MSEFHQTKEQNTFSPEHSYPNDVHRKFLRVRIRNKGRRTVHNCEAQLKALIPKNDVPMRYPSDDPKQLAWGKYPQDKDDLQVTKDIHAHGYRLLHIAFSDSDFKTTPVREAPTRHACISTREHLQMGTRAEHRANYLTVEDSFSEGEYIVLIEITTEEGRYVKSRFKVYVGTNWRDLRMRRISSFEKIWKMGRNVLCIRD